jgi:hypothetical protein
LYFAGVNRRLMALRQLSRDERIHF